MMSRRLMVVIEDEWMSLVAHNHLANMCARPCHYLVSSNGNYNSRRFSI